MRGFQTPPGRSMRSRALPLVGSTPDRGRCLRPSVPWATLDRLHPQPELSHAKDGPATDFAEPLPREAFPVPTSRAFHVKRAAKSVLCPTLPHWVDAANPLHHALDTASVSRGKTHQSLQNTRTPRPSLAIASFCSSGGSWRRSRARYAGRSTSITHVRAHVYVQSPRGRWHSRSIAPGSLSRTPSPSP